MTVQTPKYIDNLASGPTIEATDVFAGMRGRVGYKWTAAQIATYVGAGSGSVGTVTSGTWQATVIGVAYGGTGTGSWPAGSMFYGLGGASISLLTAGADYTVLTMAGNSAGVPGWTYPFIPQVIKSVDYTLVAADASKHILHPSADTGPRTWTIPSNASVPYRIGTTITFVNQHGAGDITIAINSDTMRLAGAGTTGSRTLVEDGLATAMKITATEWIISGTGLS